MRILMLNPPFLPKFSRFSRSPAVTKSGTLYYPIWHAYATGLLEQKGHAVRLVDAPAQGLDAVGALREAVRFSPEMAVLYTSTPSIYSDVEMAACIKEAVPGAFVVLTGPHVSALPEETLALCGSVDAIARREYDITLCELASMLPGRNALGDVAGITYRTPGGSIVSTPDRDFISDLDSLPFVSSVYKRHLNVGDYFYAHCRYPAVSIFTSRGCNARCNYCVYPEQMFGRRQRQRSPENIVAEFEYIQREMPEVKEVLIDDDTFSFNQEHTAEFCELMVRRGIRIPWTVECRASLSYETMSLMKRAGCRLIVVGFESADDAILKNIKKGMTFKKMTQFVNDAKRAKVMIHACFMAGNEGETRETLKRSLDFAAFTGADTCQFFPLMVYPGTEAYEWARKNGYLTATNFREWLTDEGLHNCVISTPELTSRDLVNFCDYARRKYYLRPGYLRYKLWQAITKPEERKKTIKSARTFAKYLFSNGSRRQTC